jgi:HAD superfamily hydrolase (TIGR01450 family)
MMGRSLPPGIAAAGGKRKSPVNTARLDRIRHVALDLDGTVYRGGTLFSWTTGALERLRHLGIGCTFLTNNSARSVEDYVAHLRAMGIEATPTQIHTSGAATIEHLAAAHPGVRRLFVLGTRSLRDAFAAAGFEPAGDTAADEPDAVVVGFDTTLTFERLCRAAHWIARGKPFIATHPDRVCPTDQPTVLVDCGSITAALREATGHAPDAVLGKPDPRMLQGILAGHGLEPVELAMVGDRLYTDIRMARAAGVLAVLVLSGETTAGEAERADPPPDLVCADLGAFVELLAETRGAAGRSPGRDAR